MGYRRVAGELNGLGLAISATTVRKLLRQAGWHLPVNAPAFPPRVQSTAWRFRRFTRARKYQICRVDVKRTRPLWAQGIDLGLINSRFAAETEYPHLTRGAELRLRRDNAPGRKPAHRR